MSKRRILVAFEEDDGRSDVKRHQKVAVSFLSNISIPADLSAETHKFHRSQLTALLPTMISLKRLRYFSTGSPARSHWSFPVVSIFEAKSEFLSMIPFYYQPFLIVFASWQSYSRYNP
jgi:hypothetical protein